MESGHICHIWAYLILYITLHAHHEAQDSACIPQTQFWASVAGLPPAQQISLSFYTSESLEANVDQ
jgi:hypothetical protein